MMTKALALIVPLFLVGCACKPQIVVEREIAYVPVSSCVEPPKQESIELPISKITKDTPNSELVKLYAATIELLKGEIKAKDLIIEGYRKPKDAKPESQAQPTEVKKEKD